MVKKIDKRKFPTLRLKTDREIAEDFATKVYKKFKKIIKSVILFGSQAKGNIKAESDIDIIIVIDDVSLNWTPELVVWYREELDKILKSNPYSQNLHINTIKISTWWEDLMKGDPVVLNIVRNGIPIIDYGGFFEPLQMLMARGKIKSTPEAVYQALQRAPTHINRAVAGKLYALDSFYWAIVDSAHAALIAAGFFPPSPEHVAMDLLEFVDNNLLKKKYVSWYKEIFKIHKQIDYKQIVDVPGEMLDLWQKRSNEFLEVMINLVKRLIESDHWRLRHIGQEKN